MPPLLLLLSHGLRVHFLALSTDDARALFAAPDAS
jgi:hypothetical protein